MEMSTDDFWIHNFDDMDLGRFSILLSVFIYMS